LGEKKAADRPPFRAAFSRIGMKGQGARLELKARSEEHQEPFPLFEPVYQWFSNIETGLSEFPVPGPVDYHDYRDAGRANSAGSER